MEYHASKPAGKITVVPTKPHGTQRELSLAYSPGVAYPCKEIEGDPDEAYKYTSKGNLVAVVSNGTAVLGLGDIGALAGKPVMEGKGLLFKAFADIDVFDIEVDRTGVDEFVEAVKAIAPTFGGINLEDIKAPECFEIERRLVKELDIPVMHDDQHGTAIISGAALLNGLEIVEKDISEIKVVVSGAGASAISCAHHYVRLGVKPENMILIDSKGVLTNSRQEAGELNEYKAEFARDLRGISIRRYRDLFRTYGPRSFLYAEMVFGNTINVERLLASTSQDQIFAMRVPRDIPLTEVTAKTGLSRDEVKRFNPALIRRVPARANLYLPSYVEAFGPDVSFWQRPPSDAYTAVLSEFVQLDASVERWHEASFEQTLRGFQRRFLDTGTEEGAVMDTMLAYIIGNLRTSRRAAILDEFRTSGRIQQLFERGLSELAR